MSSTVRRRVRVRGRVQGVWFRESTRKAAEAHGVAGWVCNHRDGSVEAVLEGPAAAVEAVIAFCGHGPPGASVDELNVSEEPPHGLVSFEIRRSPPPGDAPTKA